MRQRNGSTALRRLAVPLIAAVLAMQYASYASQPELTRVAGTDVVGVGSTPTAAPRPELDTHSSLLGWTTPAQMAVAYAEDQVGGAPDPDVSVVLAVLAFARAQLGLPYQWGGNGPMRADAGFDCSGLTHAAYAAAGVFIPRTAHTQFYAGPHVPAGAALQPGDLVFYGTLSRLHHVGLYIGEGLMIHAPTFGEVVQIAPYRWTGDDYAGATRPSGGPGATGGFVPAPSWAIPTANAGRGSTPADDPSLPNPTPGATVSPAPSPDPTPSPSPTPSPEPTSTPAPTPSPEPTPSPSPTPSPEPTPSPSPTPSPDPAPTPTPTPDPSPSPIPAPDLTPSPAAVTDPMAAPKP